MTSDKSDNLRDNAQSFEGFEERPRSLGLLERIKQTLSATAPERWESAGEELDSSKKHQRSRDAWEQIFCTDVKNGVLVLRCSTPVKAKYFGGGYSLEENGLPQYTIEVRPRGWQPRMLIDPYFRASGNIDKQYQTLVEGDIARQLYLEVDLVVKQFRESLKKDFADSIERFLSVITERVSSTFADEWQVEEVDRTTLNYSAEIDGLRIDLTRMVKDLNFYFEMSISKHGLKWDCKDTTLMKEVFEIVDESIKHTTLENLGKVLEEML